jgi:hypothetical protein
MGIGMGMRVDLYRLCLQAKLVLSSAPSAAEEETRRLGATSQMLRVCDVCGALLSVLDSDKCVIACSLDCCVDLAPRPALSLCCLLVCRRRLHRLDGRRIDSDASVVAAVAVVVVASAAVTVDLSTSLRRAGNSLTTSAARNTSATARSA